MATTVGTQEGGGLAQLLRTTRLQQLLEARARGGVASGVVAFSTAATIGHALSVLSAEGIRSAPIVNVAAAAAAAGTEAPLPQQLSSSTSFKRGDVVGWVETAAVVDALLHCLPTNFWPPTPDDLEAAGAALCACPVTRLLRSDPDQDAAMPSAADAAAAAAAAADGGKASGAKGGALWPCVGLEDSVLSVAAAFASTRAQHLLVTPEGGSGSGDNSSNNDADAPVVAVVSQSDIVKFLAAGALGASPALAHATLASLGLAGRAICAAGAGGGVGGGSTLLPLGAPGAASRTSAGPSRMCVSSGGCTSSGSAAAAMQQHASTNGSGGARGVGWRLATVPQAASALDAFRACHAKGVSGVAVTGARGELAGHLSASDVRCLRPGVFSQLLLPVRDFLAAHVPPAPRGSGGGCGVAGIAAAAPAGASAAGAAGAPAGLPLAGRVLCAQPHGALAALVAALARQRVHRAYVADSDGAPVGVVTMTDVLAAVGAHCASAGAAAGVGAAA